MIEDDTPPEADYFAGDPDVRTCAECGEAYQPTSFLGVLCDHCQFDADFPDDLGEC